MMRITREEENFIGRARAGLHGRVKVGFRNDGRITALDLFIVQDNGPYDSQGDAPSAASTASLAYQPLSMRYRSISVLTNTAPRTSQRSPGGMQQNAIMEPLLARAARQLGLDQVELHRVNAPAGKASYDPPNDKGKRPYVTSAFVREALDRGVEVFKWHERRARAGLTQRGEGHRCRRIRQPLQRRLLHRVRRSDHDPAGWKAVQCSRASGTSARTRSLILAASPPRP